MSRALTHYTPLALCAALSAAACGDSMDAASATETNVRRGDPPAAGAAGAAGVANATGPSGASGSLGAGGSGEGGSGEGGSGEASSAGGAGDGATPPPTPSPPDAGSPAASAAFPGETCDGCARFFVPMTGENQRADFELLLAAPIDMTGATLTFRLMANAFTGTAGGVSVYVRDAGNFDKGFVWTNLNALAAWTEVVVDFNTTLTGNVSFDITRVAKIGVQLNSAGTFAGASWQEATVYLDAVRFSNDPAADLTFSDGSGDFTLATPDAPAGSAVGFIAP